MSVTSPHMLRATIPQRIQLKRTKGWRMPPHARKVDRSTRWGNPYPVGPERSAAEAVGLFSAMLETMIPEEREDYLAPLRGYDLACWCKPGSPCHADILLQWANAPTTPNGDHPMEEPNTYPILWGDYGYMLGDRGDAIACPVCGFGYNHMARVEVEPVEGERYTFNPDGLDVSPSNAQQTQRGTSITVGLWCENGHTWDLRLEFYKGHTLLKTIHTGDTEGAYLPTGELWRD